jgi:hypothetical protein
MDKNVRILNRQDGEGPFGAPIIDEKIKKMGRKPNSSVRLAYCHAD